MRDGATFSEDNVSLPTTTLNKVPIKVADHLAQQIAPRKFDVKTFGERFYYNEETSGRQIKIHQPYTYNDSVKFEVVQPWLSR